MLQKTRARLASGPAERGNAVMGDRESENIEDRRGAGMPMAVGGIGGIGAIIVVVVGLFLGIDPSTLMSLLNGEQPQQQSDNRSANNDNIGGYSGSYDPSAGYGTSRPPESAQSDTARHFVAVVLADTEDVWKQVFGASGRTYVEPKLVLYTGHIASACGFASTASGPFYCPNDQKVYLDLSFFEEMKSRFHAPGEFAEAYVIAHEIAITCRIRSASCKPPIAKRREATGVTPMRSRCASNCRPIAWLASGPTTPTAQSTLSSRAMSRRR